MHIHTHSHAHAHAHKRDNRRECKSLQGHSMLLDDEKPPRKRRRASRSAPGIYCACCEWPPDQGCGNESSQVRRRLSRPCACLQGAHIVLHRERSGAAGTKLCTTLCHSCRAWAQPEIEPSCNLLWQRIRVTRKLTRRAPKNKPGQ